MEPIYTDGSGNYFQKQNKFPDGSFLVNKRNVSEYTSLQVAAASYPGTKTVAPSLTDLGGAIWVNGLLVDPTS